MGFISRFWFDSTVFKSVVIEFVRTVFIRANQISFLLQFSKETRVTVDQWREFVYAVVVYKILLFLLFISALKTHAISINFEEIKGMDYQAGKPIPVESRLSDQYAKLYGIIFSSLEAPYVPIVNLGNGHATSGINGMGSSKSIQTKSRPNDSLDVIHKDSVIKIDIDKFDPNAKDQEIDSVGKVLTYESEYPIIIRFISPLNNTQPATTDYFSIRSDLWAGKKEIVIEAYDLNGRLIAKASCIDSGGDQLTLSKKGIHLVKVFSTGDVAFDDLVFNPVVTVQK